MSPIEPGSTKRAPSEGSALLVAAVVTVVMLVILYAALAIEHGVALVAQRPDLATQLTAWFTSASFIYGEGALTSVLPWYEKASVRMAMHMALGGLALGLGVLQFVPSLRRHHPHLHRAGGAVVWVATCASMLGAIAFLAFVPASEGASGAAFHLGLWGLALLTLGLLYQAVLAAWSRDFRSHMVWMALVFAALGTAPMLRVDWVAFHYLWPGQPQETVNLAAGALVFMQTTALMALWLSRVGDRDLPSRSTKSSPWPHWLLVAIAAATSLGALQEAVFVHWGLDPWADVRGPLDRLPGVAMIWALGVVATMIMLPRAWQAARRGERPSMAVSLGITVASLGACLIGAVSEASTMVPFATSLFWSGYAVFVLTALVLAHVIAPTSSERNAWAMISMAALWLPSQLGGLVAIGLATGASFGEAMAAGLVIGVGGVVAAGIAAGFGARVRLLASAPTARAAALGT